LNSEHLHLFRGNAVVLENLVSLCFTAVFAYSFDEAKPVEVIANVLDVGQGNRLAAVGADFGAVIHKVSLGKEFQEWVSGQNRVIEHQTDAAIAMASTGKPPVTTLT
jgi:hypothetical protein